MKCWVEKTCNYSEDRHIKFYLGWFNHYDKHSYKGLTIELMVFENLFTFTYVNNYKLYQEVMNKRFKKREPRKKLTPSEDKDKI